MSQALPTGVPDDVAAGAHSNVAGEALRTAREAAGLSIDVVAQHLKLAPRQVRALEDGDYAMLPGRTFVRGFARNYARLMQLDADAVVAALPDATIAPALDKPALGSTAHGVGELDERPRRSSRGSIPVLMVALAVLAAVVDWNRPQGYLRSLVSEKETPATPLTRAPSPAAPGSVVPLRNPLTSPESEPAGNDPASSRDVMPPGDAGTTPTASGPANETQGSVTRPASPPSPAAPASGAPVTLVIEYRATSWTDVRDGNGQRLLVGTMPAGSRQTVSGTPPFDVVLGNVSHTTVTWRGATVDTSAHHKQNVARLRLD
jgi:cytoskeleton protein RodZ